jgi:hypothetical protein
MKLSALDVALNATFVKERSYHIHATLVTYQDDFVCQMFGANM